MFNFEGVTYHLTDIYLEELGKHGETLKPVKAVRMIIPFFKLMALSTKYAFLIYVVCLKTYLSCLYLYFIKKMLCRTCKEKNFRTNNRMLRCWY